MDLILNQNVTIYNAELKKITTEIREAGANVIGNTYKIAGLISEVDRNELYLEDGFVDVFDYVKQCFGLEKASAYNLIRVGTEFIEKTGNNYETLLTHGKKDYSLTQVVKMLPLGIDKAKELTADGVIDENMSCRQIEKIVKENTEGTKARGKKKTEPEPTTEPNTEPEEDDDTTIICAWEDLPEDICNWFRENYEFENFDTIGEIIIK